jgi:UDP-N-acetylmuramoylalanine--D-glutamate ligase
VISTLYHKKIGIWGFGITGQSMLRYLSQTPCSITVFEQKELSPDLLSVIEQHKATVWRTPAPAEFIEDHDFIIPSPGVDLEPYRSYFDKFVTELDLFHASCQVKTIAITGSVGKTSITHLLGQLMHVTGTSVSVGGNIGIGMLDLVHEKSDLFVLELSSFQLEHCKNYAPDVAVITNLYPNHLDRHQTLERYFAAKYAMIMHQNEHQCALLPLDLIAHCNVYPTRSQRYFFSWITPTQEQMNQLQPNDGLFFVENSVIIFQKQTEQCNLISIDQIPLISLPENWLILYSILFLMKIPLDVIQGCRHNLKLPEDRLEKIATINEVTFYNDSKSTTNQSTIAAVRALAGRPIHLFLGGVSKGVDREPLIAYLKNNVVHVYCFGKEADNLHALCVAHGIPSSSAQTLEDAFNCCMQIIESGDQVLLSPGGASFDLFKDYKERGVVFKNLVAQYGRKSV